MTRILAVVEGQTEETFVRELLARELAPAGKYLTAFLVGKPGKKGGIRPYPAIRADLLRLLRQDTSAYFTTMFDYYALPPDFPGFEAARQAGTPAAKAAAIQSAMSADLASSLGSGWNASKLIPYIQMHEFEAILFTDPSRFAKAIDQPVLAQPLTAIRNAFEDPEHIDKGKESHPSRRIADLFTAYTKPLHGVLGALEIGLEAILAACPHFSGWVSRLRQLP